MRAVDTSSADVRQRVSAEEWAARVDLAAAYRLVEHFGWDDLVFTHISARLLDSHDFLINPYGFMFDEITASNLVRVDLQGNKTFDSPYEINPAGYMIHSAIHEVRADAGCVLHLHTREGMAVSCQKAGVLPISQQASMVIPSLSYHDYEGIALNPDEKRRLQKDLGNAHYLMLRNHGLLTVGLNVPDAFLNMYAFQRTCEIQLLAQGHGAELIHISDAILATGPVLFNAVTRGAGSALTWPALLRRLDRIDGSYRT